MSDLAVETKKRVNFDPTVNLGHLISATVFLATASMGFAVLRSKVEQQKIDIERVERQAKDYTDRIERQWSADQQRDREAFTEIKVLLREINSKLDQKQDKPRGG